MSKGNGQADVSLEEQLKEEQNQAVEKELPVADPADGFEEKNAAGSDSQVVAPAAGSELEKLRAERNDLFERLARLQAEFDNYRKRAAKENAEYRDYAVSEIGRASCRERV